VVEEDYLLPFQFYVPLFKSKGGDKLHGEDLWWVEGHAATDRIDQQKEKLILAGMDYAPLLKSGVINWDHGSGPEDILGEPTAAKVIEKTNSPSIFYTKGWLYKHVPRSQSVWNHLQALEKGEQPITRKFGWSVQGGVLERQGSDLVKSVVRHLALTHQPVNVDTWAKCVSGLVKSLQGVGIGAGGYPPIGQGVSDLRPMTPQNLDATVTSLIYNPCKSGCMDKSGTFNNGYHGMLNHLVLCKKVPIPEAKQFVMLMAKEGVSI